MVRSVEEWLHLSALPRFWYPELVAEELSGHIWRGRWWDWLPSWAQSLREFAEEVDIVAGAMKVDRVELARSLVSASNDANSNGIFSVLYETTHPVPNWLVVLLVKEWIFYELRPELRFVMQRYLDPA